ncbi:hypothetical protein FACS189443_1140 [Planctomycetales bacterium]|nr:hypothetical protein FACS189443_1140 [Planctomycetales bacterium]
MTMQNTATNNLRNGITLLEVLISVFIIGIGLLGVLAIIPFGAYQVSKANNAEYAANMLANAAGEIKIRKLAYPTEWGDAKYKLNDSEENKSIKDENNKIDCTKIVLLSEATQTDKGWEEIFRGQDDYEYKIDETTNQPDLTVTVNGEKKIRKSTGRYTWFFTYRLYEALDAATLADPTTTNNFKNVELAHLSQKVNVDILGCYNRVSADDLTPLDAKFQPALNSGMLTLKLNPTDPPKATVLDRLAQTKYVLATWDDTPKPRNGAWCKILFVDKNVPNDADGSPRINIIVSGDAIVDNDVKVRILHGILYHKQVPDVTISD